MQRFHPVGWPQVCHPLSRGVLGIRCLKVVKLVLLGKWLWRLVDDSNGLWLSIICEKNWVTNGRWCIHNMHRNSSAFWISVIHVAGSFFQNIRLRVGQGDRIKFWNDCWAAGEPLADLFPSLYCIAVNPEARVADNFSPQAGVVSGCPLLQRDLFDWEEDDLLSLYHLLNGIYISPRCSDRQSWKLDSQRVFSVKSFNAFLAADGSSISH